MSGEALGELVFMMVILKIPVAYLCVVVYWAVRAEPRPPEPAWSPARLPEPDADPHEARSTGRRRRPPSRPPLSRRPHGGPVRTYARRLPAVRAGAR